MLKLKDIGVRVRHRIGDLMEEDCSCDSDFMMEAMDRVGAAIRKAYSWVPPHQKCFLVMDNAGGHGTTNAINLYTEMLRVKYKVQIIFQVPRSPYTNVLDLGVWMSLQAAVERRHYLRCYNKNALVKSVTETWTTGQLDVSINNVFLRIKNVLCNILEGGGSNDLVEKKREKKHKDIKIEKIISSLHRNCNDNDINPSNQGYLVGMNQVEDDDDSIVL